MSKIELVMPKMGESIMEATILKWLKNPGDKVELDETILEIATDKVDSEIPSPAEGIISEIFFKENDVVEVGTVIATLTTETADLEANPSPAVSTSSNGHKDTKAAAEEVPYVPIVKTNELETIETVDFKNTDRFYSPLVKNIAKQENISLQELEQIKGTGQHGRVTKTDILSYIDNRPTSGITHTVDIPKTMQTPKPAPVAQSSFSEEGNVEIIAMDRMRKLISDHMVMSKQTSPHVTSFVEADVTNIVKWRDKIKGEFQKKYGEKITFTPIFIESVVKAIADYPMVNISVEGNNIILKKNINIGMAAALPSGNLIVPVIKDANMLNLVGITKKVNDLAARARINKLKPEEIQDGTFTLTNVGTFGNLMGTPIINQPQVAILATGSIKKKPVVLETTDGDVIAIRHMMYLSLSYDHRVVDGALGGSFLRRVADYLEQFNENEHQV